MAAANKTVIDPAAMPVIQGRSTVSAAIRIARSSPSPIPRPSAAASRATESSAIVNQPQPITASTPRTRRASGSDQNCRAMRESARRMSGSVMDRAGPRPRIRESANPMLRIVPKTIVASAIRLLSSTTNTV
jgi:hypothetical protein